MDPRASSAAEREPPVTLADELAEHERLLRRGTAQLRVRVVRAAALSYGVSVHDDATYLQRARAEGLPTVGRSTGGTGLLHLPGDLVWAVVLPRDDPRVGRDFARAFDRLGAGISDGLRAAGVEAGWAPAPGLSDDYCPLSSRGSVLVAAGRVLGGAAQHATSRALLHHGGISWTVDRPRVGRIFGPLPATTLERLGGVGDLGATLTAARLAAALERAFVRTPPPGPLS